MQCTTGSAAQRIDTILQFQQESKIKNAGTCQALEWNLVQKNMQEKKSSFAIYCNNVKTVCFN